MIRICRIFVVTALLVCSCYAGERQRTIVHNEPALYPDIARELGLHGSVKLKIWIKPDGTVRRIEYLGGHPLLAESALKAVKNWTYEPANEETNTVVEIKF
jgi:TonB family protein